MINQAHMIENQKANHRINMEKIKLRSLPLSTLYFSSYAGRYVFTNLLILRFIYV